MPWLFCQALFNNRFYSCFREKCSDKFEFIEDIRPVGGKAAHRRRGEAPSLSLRASLLRDSSRNNSTVAGVNLLQYWRGNLYKRSDGTFVRWTKLSVEIATTSLRTGLAMTPRGGAPLGVRRQSRRANSPPNSNLFKCSLSESYRRRAKLPAADVFRIPVQV